MGSVTYDFVQCHHWKWFHVLVLKIGRVSGYEWSRIKNQCRVCLKRVVFSRPSNVLTIRLKGTTWMGNKLGSRNTLIKHIQQNKTKQMKFEIRHWNDVENSAVNRINITKVEAINHHRRRHIRVLYMKRWPRMTVSIFNMLCDGVWGCKINNTSSKYNSDDITPSINSQWL